ncbi:carboxylating nicotinate-nucleotide diphosphorylase [Thermodesulforhabdus norvegica]|uniref:Probable nicotinate-nucleotide pyrophosphorylase [carboxylating] n=1 Tax=Thermodesulforhabdus norvegica TaxID=39841 RepID=A0A1I4UVQ6_9BACT|nr:carboxylating nicotinate-nucleotide diphosphorylase [Thermodesulforhabdus norvegica]SFM92965.1 nicotinate-nucleotide pyrophosphorylase [carboxylating] [Thermodesulforhabdus norvegica]
MFPVLEELLKAALYEDIGPGDVTTLAVVGSEDVGIGEIVAREELVLSGRDIPRGVFYCLGDQGVEIESFFRDGDVVRGGDVIFRFRGKVRTLLQAERVMLNLLQRLCGIATMTRKMVTLLEGTGCRLLDTRKTTPLWRRLEKNAVRHGGGQNHRFGLFDGVLIKDNHIIAAGSIGEAVRRVRESVHHLLKIEVEVESLDQLEAALAAGVDMVLLDNFTLPELKEAVAMCRGRVLCEASGGIGLHNVRQVAETGVDFISSGAITHSAPAADMSFKLVRIL